MQTTLSVRYSISVLTVFLVIGMTGCEIGNEKKPLTQTAAKVNSEEISVHQINYILGRNNISSLPPEQVSKVRREILDRLVDQQLTVEEALQKKLDRAPSTLMALESARREILSRAYIEQLIAAQPKPTRDEAKKYFSEHPLLFVERRIYGIQELVFPASDKLTGPLHDMVTSGKSMDDIAAWLKARDVKFSGQSTTRPAEQIPLELLPKLHALKDGQALVLDNEQNVIVMRLVNSQAAPVSEAIALPKIMQFLGNQRAGETIENEMKRIKGKATISYLGEFSDAQPLNPAPIKKESANSMVEKGIVGIR